MKIIQLIYSLSSGGAERFVVNLSNELSRQGHDVTICMLLNTENPAWCFNKKFIHPSVKFHSLGFSQGFSLKKVKTVHKYILKEQPDVVHCHLNVIPYIYLTACRNHNIKFFHTIHNIAQKASGLKIQYLLNRFFYKRNITPIAISKICLESFEKYYHLKNITRIDNGCPTVMPSQEFGKTKTEVDNYKTSINTPVFIHVARCHPSKNQDLLIDSFNKLNDNSIDYTLLILGSGFDSPEGIRLKQKACSKIHFLGEKSNVGDYWLCSDAFCLTSLYEGLPISLIEALSCGITPICTPVGGIPDVITDSETGYLSENLSIESYYHTLKRFMTSKLDKKHLTQYYMKYYSISSCANKYINIYKFNN